MNILVVHETEYMKKVVFEYQVIPELWASWGHNVYVVDFETDWERSSLFNLREKTRVLKNVKKSGKVKGVTLIRPGFIKLSVFDRLSTMVSHYRVIKQTIKDKKIDVIFLYSVPTNGYQTLRAARQTGTPVYFRLLDVLNQLVPSKMLSKPTFHLERYVYPRVNQLTAITPRLTKYAIKMGAKPETTSYLPSASDDDLFFPKKKDAKLMSELGLKTTDKVVCFAGTLYNFSGLDKVLEYFGKNLKKFPRVKFLVIGHGEQEERLKEIIAKYDMEKKVIMTGFVQYEKLNDYLNLSDICINPFEINKTTDIIFPGKIYQYLACEKPVIATKLPGVVDIFKDNGGKNNIYYYNYKRVKEFFDLIKKIKIKKIKNLEPSLQDIAKAILNDLQKLV